MEGVVIEKIENKSINNNTLDIDLNLEPGMYILQQVNGSRVKLIIE